MGWFRWEPDILATKAKTHEEAVQLSILYEKFCCPPTNVRGLWFLECCMLLDVYPISPASTVFPWCSCAEPAHVRIQNIFFATVCNFRFVRRDDVGIFEEIRSVPFFISLQRLRKYEQTLAILCVSTAVIATMKRCGLRNK